MSEWQPIETCPEATIVLLYADTSEPAFRNWRIATGSKHHRDYPTYENESQFHWGGRNLMKWELHPTHWMPLPEPPK